MQAVPVMLISACVGTLFTVRIFTLLAAAFYPRVTSGRQNVTPLAHASLIVTSLLDFVDVALMAIALLLLLKYNYVVLPQLYVQPDPHVRHPQLAFELLTSELYCMHKYIRNVVSTAEITL